MARLRQSGRPSRGRTPPTSGFARDWRLWSVPRRRQRRSSPRLRRRRRPPGRATGGKRARSMGRASRSGSTFESGAFCGPPAPESRTGSRSRLRAATRPSSGISRDSGGDSRTRYIPGVPGRIFLLSPASCSGKRARLVFNPEAGFDVARRLRSPEGAPVGDVFTFLSGLYFRGKLAYARRYARPPEGTSGVLIITAGAGLVGAEEPVTLSHLERFARVPIDAGEERYRRPLDRSARSLAERAEG